MSLKTCKVLQIIAVCLFAFALIGVVLSIPFQHMLTERLYQFEPALSSQRYDQTVKATPIIPLISSAVYLVISAIYLAALKKSGKSTLLYALIICSLLFFIYDAGSELFMRGIVDRLFERHAEEGFSYYFQYTMLNTIAMRFMTLFTVPAKILMFLSLGGSIEKGKKSESSENSELSGAADGVAADGGASASKAAATESGNASPASQSHTLASKPMDKNEYYAAFMRPADGEAAQTPDEELQTDSEEYLKSFRKPENSDEQQ